MTMVMSLIVLPARADAPDPTAISVGSTATVTRGSNATISATAPTSAVNNSGETKTYSELTTAGYTKGAETWSWSTTDNKVTLSGQTTNAVTVTGVTAGNAMLTCNYAVTFTKAANTENNTPADTINVNKSATVTVTVDNPVFSASDIASISYKERVCTLSGSTVSAPYFTASESSTLSTTASDWGVTLKSTPFKLKSAVYDGTKLTVTETGDSHFDLTVTPNALTPTFTAAPSSGTIGKNASVTLTASNYSGGISELPIYKWTYGSNNTEIGTGASLTWKPVVASGATYPVTIAVKCTAYEGSVKTAERSFNIQVTNDDYVITLPAVGKLPTNAANIFTLVPGTAAGSNFQFYKNDANKTHIASNVTYTYSSSAPSVATISSDGKISTLAAGSTNITITATYNGAAYTRTFAVQVVNPTSTLGSTYCG